MLRLLIIDNDQNLLYGLDAFFKREKFEVMIASNGESALEIIQTNPPDLIISAVMIPSPNGYDIKKILNQNTSYQDIPFIILTTRSSLLDILNGIVRYQIDDFITKPFDPTDLLIQVKLLLLCSKAKMLHPSIQKTSQDGLLFQHLSKALEMINEIYRIQNSHLTAKQIQASATALYVDFLQSKDIQVDLDEHLLKVRDHLLDQELVDFRNQTLKLNKFYSPFESEVDCNLMQLFFYHFMIAGLNDGEYLSDFQIKKMNAKNFFSCLSILNTALEMANHESSQHRLRLANLIHQYRRHIKYEKFDLEQLYLGAFFHDLGMINVPRDNYQKMGKLSQEEFAEIKEHPLYASELLSKIDYLKPIIPIPLYHHERWNGSGYPYGLREEAIPIEARIFSILDSWVSMTSPRIFRSAFGWEDVAVYFEKESGISFQKDLLESFTENLLAGILE